MTSLTKDLWKILIQKEILKHKFLMLCKNIPQENDSCINKNFYSKFSLM